MEQIDDQLEQVQRRQHVATFIQDSLQPAKHMLEEGLLDNIEEDITQEAQNFEVREYQLDAWGSLWEARQNGAKTGLIHLATGLGKTSVGVFDVIKYRDEYQGRRLRGPRILFASHKNEINEQAAERFAAFIPDATQGFFNGTDKISDADITFATLQSLHGNLDKFRSGHFDYIIYDEAHHGRAETFAKVIQHFKPKFQLALTATPNRLDKLDIRELFGQELYSKSLSDALAEGLLANPDYHIVFDDTVKEAMQSGFEATSLKALSELFAVKPRNEVIAKNIKEEMEKMGLEFGSIKTIVFCQNVQHAEEMAELLGGQPYHSGVKKRHRDATLNAFRNVEFQVITTRDMFNEGVDIPDARLLIFLRSTASPTVFEQQLGRGLRKYPGKDRVSVLDFAANIERIAMIQELAQSIRSKAITSNDNELLEFEYDPNNLTVNGGLVLHTNHTDFNFDRLTVDLLDKYYESIRNEGPAPEEFRYIGDVAESLDCSRALIMKSLEGTGITGRRMVGESGHNGLYFSPEEITLISESISDLAPEEWLSQLGMKQVYGIKQARLASITKELNITGHERRGIRGNPGIFFSPEEQERIIEVERSVGQVPEDWPSEKSASKTLGISPQLLSQLASDAGIKVLQSRNHLGKHGTYYSPEQIEIISQVLAERIAPTEDELVLTTISKEFGIKPYLFTKYAESLGITGVQRFYKSKPGTYFNREDIRKVLELRDSIPVVGEGYQSFEQVAKVIHGRHAGLSRKTKETGITGSRMRARNGIGTYFSPEEVKILLGE